MTVLIGTCSWTDRVTEQAQHLYHTARPTAEQKLRCYATLFPTVEVDSTFYALPAPQTCQQWAQRTPDGFVFHVKAFSLFTTHRTQTQTLPAEVRQMLPQHLQTKDQLTPQEVPEPVKDKLWRLYRETLEPLQMAGKLGCVLLQFAPWFKPTAEAAEYIRYCREQLAGFDVAVEFRHKEWFEGRLRERTLKLLRDNNLTNVSLDMPQGFDTSILPIIEATTNQSYVRLHGRNTDTWERSGMPVNNIHDYWYTESELQEWLDWVRQLEKQTDQVYVLFNTVQGLHTALEFQEMAVPDSNRGDFPANNGTHRLF